MITDNTQKSPMGAQSLLTFEEWETQFGSQYANLSKQDKIKKYQEWLNQQQGSQQQQTPTTTTAQFTDNTGSQPTERQQNKPASNVDMMGITNTLTQFGISTGNSDMAKAGVLGSTALNVVNQVKGLKGLKGVDKTAGIAGIAGGAADTLDNMFFGNQRANNSALTNGMNDAYDFASSAMASLGPTGKIISGGMKVGGLVSDALTALGVGTDQMTTTDKILDSKLMKLTPVGLINGLFSSTSDRFTIDNKVREQIGGSYGGAYSFMDDAASRAGKEYGLFSSGARDDANRDIAKAKVFQNKITDINKEARDRQSIVNNSMDLLTNNYQFNLAGGYDQKYVRAAELGAKIQRINLTLRSGGKFHNVINVDTKEIEWQPVIIEDEEVPEFKEGGTIAWKYDTWEPEIIEDEWEPTIVECFEEGGKTEKSEEEPLSNQQNVIPEGALHARKHHMENTEGLTQKGIPVIDDKGEQQAEIELNEIIFNLEVTQKLEELCKDGSDEAAIEAGKLLVQEILFNTEDRTGLIKTLKQGGTINGSTE